MIRNNNYSSSSSATAAASDVDPAMWRAVAGSSVHIPTVGSRVYYFPQGHFEHCLSSASSATATTTTGASSSLSSEPEVFTTPPPAYFHCRVISVRFLCHPVTDQPFASLHLVPIPFPSAGFSNAGCNRYDFLGDVFGSSSSRSGNNNNGENDNDDDVVSFTKILTPSDANNGGGFSVPRFCADSIFPPLNYEADPPVQNLVIRDVHGISFGFRHIYRGTPRRHLLTTGWSKFVNSKKLVASDAVVFMRRRSTGELYAGVRRAFRDDDVAEWSCDLKSMKIEKKMDDEWGIKGVVIDDVLDCLEKAVREMEFEVVFYPRPGWSDFIVKAETVEKAMSMYWAGGAKVKMSMETEDSTRTSWFHGTISAATVPESGPYRGSPWRMLQMAWDEPELLQHVSRVSPWQVEHVLPMLFEVAFPPTKKFKAWEDPLFLPSGGGELMEGFSNSMMGPLTPSYSCHTFFPAGMQGARQNQECLSLLSEVKKNDIYKMNSDKVTDNNMQWKSETLSTELNIGSLPSDASSVDNSGSFNGTGLEGKQDCSSSSKVSRQRSFQLFGKIIGLEKPGEDSGGNEECSS